MDITSDNELLGLAREALVSEGYFIREPEVAADSGHLPIVVAENQFFVIAVAATATLDGLPIAESVCSNYIREITDREEAGAKRWDLYVVLLTQQETEAARHSGMMFGINYDVRAVRRIARSGVRPTLAGVREALKPFTPPIDYKTVEIVDPLIDLVEALASQGIDQKLAQRAVSAFRQGGDLSHAI